MRLHTTSLVGLFRDQTFRNITHRLSHLAGTDVRTDHIGEHAVVTISFDGKCNPRHVEEMTNLLQSMSQHLVAPALIEIQADDERHEFFIGPHAHDQERAYFLRKAAHYLERAGETAAAAQAVQSAGVTH